MTVQQAYLMMNQHLHGFASRFAIWRRLLTSAIEKNGVWMVENQVAIDSTLKHAGDRIAPMTAYAYGATDSVNRNKVVFCPVRPTKLSPELLDVLLDADELHIIRSHDYAQKRFFEEVGQRIAARGSPCKTITYRDG
jgi:hypothetical protein